MTEELRLACQRVVTSDGVAEAALLTIRDSKIVGIDTDDARVEQGPRGRDSAVESVPGWTVPGFVDTHVHGGGGADFATTDPAQAVRARRFHRLRGTTTSFASLVSAELDTQLAQIATLIPLVESREFAGIHLEGPFLSAAKCGAHQPSLLRAPEPRLMDQLLAAGQGKITMITIAPELPGGLAAIEAIVSAGVVAAIGHTDADELITQQALDAGASVVTHLFNAMRPVHHREPGPVPLLLSDHRAVVELICDGFHLHPDVVAMAVAAAGPARVALVTDAMVAAGGPDGEYRLGDLRVRVSDRQARVIGPGGEPGSIAGSTLTMADAFANIVAMGVSIPDAAVMASTTAARRHHLDPVGEIRTGAQADLCVVDDHGVLQRVMQAGSWVLASP